MVGAYGALFAGSLCRLLLCSLPQASRAGWQRPLSVTLTHTRADGSAGYPFEPFQDSELLGEGVEGWTDRAHIYFNVPADLEGLHFFKGRHKRINSGTVEMYANYGGTAYIWAETVLSSPGEGIRDGGLIDAWRGLGWTWVDNATIEYSGWAENAEGSLVLVNSSAEVWAVEMNQHETIRWPISYMWVGGVSFRPGVTSTTTTSTTTSTTSTTSDTATTSTTTTTSTTSTSTSISTTSTWTGSSTTKTTTTVSSTTTTMTLSTTTVSSTTTSSTSSSTITSSTTTSTTTFTSTTTTTTTTLHSIVVYEGRLTIRGTDTRGISEEFATSTGRQVLQKSIASALPGVDQSMVSIHSVQLSRRLGAAKRRRLQANVYVAYTITIQGKKVDNAGLTAAHFEDGSETFQRSLLAEAQQANMNVAILSAWLTEPDVTVYWSDPDQSTSTTTTTTSTTVTTTTYSTSSTLREIWEKPPLSLLDQTEEESSDQGSWFLMFAVLAFCTCYCFCKAWKRILRPMEVQKNEEEERGEEGMARPFPLQNGPSSHSVGSALSRRNSFDSKPMSQADVGDDGDLPVVSVSNLLPWGKTSHSLAALTNGDDLEAGHDEDSSTGPPSNNSTTREQTHEQDILDAQVHHTIL